MLLEHIKTDVRSTTGRNLRKILLQTDKASVDNLGRGDLDSVEYYLTSTDDKWKEELLNELVDVRSNLLEVDGFDSEELDAILEYICVS